MNRPASAYWKEGGMGIRIRNQHALCHIHSKWMAAARVQSAVDTRAPAQSMASRAKLRRLRVSRRGVSDCLCVKLQGCPYWTIRVEKLAGERKQKETRPIGYPCGWSKADEAGGSGAAVSQIRRLACSKHLPNERYFLTDPKQ